MLRIADALLCLIALPVEAAKVPRPLPVTTIDPAPGRKPIKLADYKGKVIAIVLFGTECPACRQTVAYLSQMQTQFGQRGLQVVGAAVNSGAISLIGDFIDTAKPTYPVGVLNEAATKRLGDFTDRPYVPILMFVDRKGVVQFQYFGDHEFIKNLKQTLPALLQRMLMQK
jgi:hypothetical protein